MAVSGTRSTTSTCGSTRRTASTAARASTGSGCGVASRSRRTAGRSGWWPKQGRGRRETAGAARLRLRGARPGRRAGHGTPPEYGAGRVGHRRDRTGDDDHQLLRPGRRGHRVCLRGPRLRQDRALHPRHPHPGRRRGACCSRSSPSAVLFSWHLADVIVPKLRERGYTGEIIVPSADPRSTA